MKWKAYALLFLSVSSTPVMLWLRDKNCTPRVSEGAAFFRFTPTLITDVVLYWT